MAETLGMSNKIGNVMGVPVPFPVRAQLQTRAAMNSYVRETAEEGAYNFKRPVDNIKYLQNKTGWVRLVSSVDVSGESLKYFQDLLPEGQTLKDSSDLAKRYVLFAGTSIYQNTGDSFQYNLRQGISDNGLGAYGNFGSKNEINDYGYRPMPGITDAKIQTQGRLGSIRQATISFKVWTKDQLDIMDALYFKMGYLMFLEWGHVYYYDNKGALQQMGVTIDPFAPGLTKETLNLQIANLREKTDGNYDAMLGMCTSFNFDFNQEGGYDCTIKIIGLGALADSAKINSSATIPSFVEEQIEQFYNLFRKHKEAELIRQQQEEAAQNPPEEQDPKPKVESIDDFVTSRSSEITKENISNYIVPTSDQTYDKIKNSKSGVVVAHDSGISGILYRDIAMFIPNDHELVERYIESVTWVPSKFRPYVNVINNPGNMAVKKTKTSTSYESKLAKIDYQIDLSKDDPGLIIATTYLTSAVNGFNYYFRVAIPVSSQIYGKQYINPSQIFDVNGKSVTVKPESAYTKDSSEISTQMEVWFLNVLKIVLDKINKWDFNKEIYDADISQGWPHATIDGKPTVGIVAKDLGYSIQINCNCNIDAFVEVDTGAGGKDYKRTQISQPFIIELTDASVISAVTPPDTAEATVFKEYQDKVDAANAAAAAAEARKQKEEQDKEYRDKILDAITQEKVNYNSGIEAFLRAIQLYSLSKAVSTIGGGSTQNPNFDFREVAEINLLEGNENESIIEQLFSNTLFKGLARKYATDPKQFDEGLDINSNRRDKYKAFTAYGYNHNLMSCADPKKFVEEKKLKTCDFENMFKSWVMPYDINTEVMKDIDTNHPVYIRLDLLLHTLTQMCILYDTPKSIPTETTSNSSQAENQTPLIYIDYNTYTNTCLSTPLQMSVDIEKFMIQFRATNEQYKRLFVVEYVDESESLKAEVDKLKAENKTDAEIEQILGKKINGTAVKNLAEGLTLFEPENKETGDFISRYLPEFKDPNNTSTGAYQGRIMYTLVNIDYLLSLCKSMYSSDDSHGVYLRPFIQQLLEDMNKSLGDINMFRLAYHDSSNCLYIVDDQSSPLQEGEESARKYSIRQESYAHMNLNRNSVELPLYGRDSIAKSLNIKTEVSTKLSNMLAISANSDKKTEAGKDSTPFGQYNLDFTNRYMQQVLKSDEDPNKPTEGEKKSAEAFNDYVKSIFNTDKPQLDGKDQALNYYIERMNDKKAERTATRASAMIPVSVNFTTDGIAGLAMGHAFTLPPQLLPRTYERFTEATGKRVGFVVVGLDHSIANNIWDTTVKANMFFIKDSSDFPTDKRLFKTDDLAQGQVIGGPDNESSNSTTYPPAVGCTRDASNIIDSNQGTIDNLIKYAKKYGLTGKYAIASLVGIAGGETRFKPRDEDHIYSESNLRHVFKGLTNDQVARATKKGITKKEFFSIVYGEYNPKRVGNDTAEDGGKYYGRGFIQLTGKGNYKKYGDLAGVDLLNNPDLVNDPGETGAKIAIAYFKDRIKADQNSENYLAAALPAVGRDANGGYAKKTAIHNCMLEKIT